MMTDCRPIFADERSASRAVFCHAFIWPKHRPFLASAAGNAAGHATAPHALERELGFRGKIRKHIRVDIPSGGYQEILKPLYAHSQMGLLRLLGIMSAQSPSMGVSVRVPARRLCAISGRV
jgi:hypothetical protein